MAKKAKKETTKQLLKSVKVDILKRMEDALSDFKTGLGEKKFKKRLKKASAIFSDGIVLQQDVAPQKKQRKSSKKSAVAEPVVEVEAVA